MTSSLPRRTLMAGLVGALGLAATGCADGAGAGGAVGPGAGDGASGTGGAASAEGFPVTITNCDAEVVLDAVPERVVLLDSAPVTTLDGIGVLETVVARAGSFPPGYFSEDLNARLATIPALSEDIDATGHLQINQEVVIAQRPDLVLGLPDGITREGLRAAGAEALLPRTYCGDLEGRASFAALYEEITSYGTVFDRPTAAQELVAALRQRVDAASGPASGLSAAVLYATIGGGPLYTYGAASMATAQLDALGVRNVFADTPQRVFEISAEPLLAADPDVLIVLHEGTMSEEVVAGTVSTARLEALRAVRDGAVLPLLFNFSEPASPLVVDGLERIRAWLEERGGAG